MLRDLTEHVRTNSPCVSVLSIQQLMGGHVASAQVCGPVQGLRRPLARGAGLSRYSHVVPTGAPHGPTAGSAVSSLILCVSMQKPRRKSDLITCIQGIHMDVRLPILYDFVSYINMP